MLILFCGSYGILNDFDWKFCKFGNERKLCLSLGSVGSVGAGKEKEAVNREANAQSARSKPFIPRQNIIRPRIAEKQKLLSQIRPLRNSSRFTFQ